MLAWELFTLAFILYVMVEVPYRLAFGVTEDLPVCTVDWKTFIDIFSCFVFVADIVVQMHSASFVGKRIAPLGWNSIQLIYVEACTMNPGFVLGVVKSCVCTYVCIHVCDCICVRVRVRVRVHLNAHMF